MERISWVRESNLLFIMILSRLAVHKALNFDTKVSIFLMLFCFLDCYSCVYSCIFFLLVTDSFFVFCSSEQYFGSPSDMASAAEHIREKMKLVSLKKQQLRQPEATTPES